MSRIAKRPVTLPENVQFARDGDRLTVTGPQGELSMRLHASVRLREEDGALRFDAAPAAMAMAGTMNALLRNHIRGVAQGYEKRLELVGVGYRAQMQGERLRLNLGFSHPIDYAPPAGVALSAPSPTEVVVSGPDKQKVGQAAAEIRAYRPPEPYKGKGVRYGGERVLRKEAKKK